MRAPAFLIAFGLAALAALPARADCAAIGEEIKAALQSRAVARFDELAAKLRADPSCDGAYRAEIGRTMARTVLTTLPSDSDPARIEPVLRYGRPWQVLVAAGDAYYDRKVWEKAVPLYEEALDDMRDTAANPRPPPREVEERTYKRAVQARALATKFIANRQFRGQRSGLASPQFRNFTATAVPVPVQFETDRSDLTPEGIAAVTDIYGYLGQKPYRVVRIIGHTDPRGSDAYNLDLSKRRAQMVADYLRHLGYRGALEIVGRGRSERFQPDDPAKYSVDQLYAFDRRVEYQTVE